MAEIAVVVIDPGKNRWAQLVDNEQRVRDLVPALVNALDLPGKLNYQLIHVVTSAILGPSDTLASAGVAPGGELLLKPVRDRLLKMILDKLYDEAKGYAKDQLWDMAKDKLGELARLDPEHPDPVGLKEAIQSLSPGAPPAPTKGPLPAAQKDQVKREAARKAQPAQKARQQAPKKTAPKAKPRQGAGRGCLIVGGVAGAGVVLVGAVIVAVLVLPEILDSPPSPPSTEEVVLGTGDVQVTLRWDSTADLDLHVLDPYGEELWYDHKSSASGGILDVDANAACFSQMANPVENVYWPTGGAPTGEYSVGVVYFANCGEVGPTDFEVIVRLQGSVYGRYPGSVSQKGDSLLITTFTQ